MAKITTPAMIAYNKRYKKGRKFSPAMESWKRFKRNRTAVVGLVLFILLVLMAIFADVIAPYEFQEMTIIDAYQGPSANHLFGTDNFGRDLFSRCVYGCRFTLMLCMLCVLTATMTGGVLGLVAGYFGGRVDNVIMRVMDVFSALPNVLLALAVSSALGNGMWQLIVAITIANLAGSAKGFRTGILTVRGAEYIESSESIGVSKLRMVIKHMVPNCVGLLVLNMVQTMSGTINIVAALSYLGIGLQPPAAEWGLLLSDGKAFFTAYPHMIIFPAIMIMFAIMAFNMMGDGLRDAFDPKLK